MCKATELDNTTVTCTPDPASDAHVGPLWLAQGLPPGSVDGPVLRDAQNNVIPFTSVIRGPVVLGGDGPRVQGFLPKSRLALDPRYPNPFCP